jgi:hypothetical protein
MTKDDFSTLVNTVKDMRDTVERHSTSMRTNARGGPQFHHGMHDFVSEAQSFASMVSQVLDNEDLSSVQRIALKGVLLQLELEVRILSSQVFN